MICWMPLGCPGRHIIMSSAEPTKSKNENVGKVADNIINRDFSTEKPLQK